MPRLLPIREQWLNGDPRALYLGWASSVWPYGAAVLEMKEGDLTEDVRRNLRRREPPVPPGLKNLDEPLKTLADFPRVDSDVLAVAVEASKGMAPAPPSRADLADWIAELPAEDARNYLVGFLTEERDAALRGELMGRFRESLGPRGNKAAGERGRTVRAILTAAEDREAERDRAEDANRARRLNELAAREDQVWCQVDEAVGRKNDVGYDQAASLLTDLRDLAARRGTLDEFRDRIAGLRKAHRGKSAFQGRLNRAGLDR